MLHLFRTVCCTNWKCQPTHSLKLIATGSREELLDELDNNVQKFMADDMATDTDLINETDFTPVEMANSVVDFFNMSAIKLKSLWQNGDRFEVDTIGVMDSLREFAQRTEDGDRLTIVYHICDLSVE